MEDIRMFPEMVIEETEKKEILVKNCLGCGNDTVVLIKDYEHEFDGEIEKHDGYVCDGCGCFHFMTDDGLTYEHIYKDIFLNGDVEWKISDN